MYIVCAEAGSYDLRTGAGPFVNDRNCNSTHCELVSQKLATLDVQVSHTFWALCLAVQSTSLSTT